MTDGLYHNHYEGAEEPHTNGSHASTAMTEPDFPSLEYLNHAIGYVEQASSMPLSASVLINREEMLSLLYTARERMPQEINYAREMLRERNLYISKVKREAEEILDRARDKAAHLMQKTEIMKEAERRAAKVVEDAQTKAAKIRREAYKYCDGKLGRFENVLQKTLDEVQAGRDKFQNDPMAKLAQQEPPPAASESPGFYDQEQA